MNRIVRKAVRHAGAAGALLISMAAPQEALGISLINVSINIPIPGLTPNPNPGVLDPAAFVTFAETATSASMSLVGGDFDIDTQSGATILGDFWTASFTISQDSGFINDVLSVNGTFQHIAAPHAGDNPIGPIYTFNFVLDADDATGNTISATNPLSLVHLGAGHKDDYTNTLTATVSTTLNFDDITGWTLALAVQHVVPEPGTALMLGLGLVGLGRASRTRRR